MRIVYLDLDSMRPDHMGCYGYSRPVTPNLDRIADGAVRFTRCYCSDSPCVPSRAAFWSGRFGIHNGIATHWGPGGVFRYPGDGNEYVAGKPMLARCLLGNGVHTVSFSSFMDRHQAHWFASGQSEMHTYTLKRGGEIAGDVNAAVLPWLENHAAQDNYFLHINYWDPHRNYRMPMEWFEKTRQMPRHTPDWPDQDAIDNMKDNWGPFSANRLFHRGKSPIPSMPDAIRTVADWRHMCDGYDAAILYMDWHIGQVLEVLERKGVLQDTAFIVSADHADDMGEHGVFGDHVCASEAVHRLPMIVKWPGVTSARECDAMIYHLDVGPTLCEMLGFPVPAGWDGRSFAPLLRSEAGEGYRRRDHLVMTHGLYSCQRVVRTEDWALFRTYHPGLFPFERLALYDMVENQRQTTNVAPRHDDVVCRLDSLLNEWLADQIGKPGSDPDPLQEVVRAGPWKYAQPDNWFRLLENDGLKEQADVIRKRLGVT